MAVHASSCCLSTFHSMTPGYLKKRVLDYANDSDKQVIWPLQTTRKLNILLGCYEYATLWVEWLSHWCLMLWMWSHLLNVSFMWYVIIYYCN